MKVRPYVGQRVTKVLSKASSYKEQTYTVEVTKSNKENIGTTNGASEIARLQKRGSEKPKSKFEIGDEVFITWKPWQLITKIDENERLNTLLY